MTVKSKKRLSLFWPIYAAFLILFAIFLIVGSSKLTRYLTGFENSQPIHLAQQVFDEYFTGDDFLAALEKAGYQSGDFESLEAASDILEGMKEGKEITFYATVQSENEACYNVVLTEPESASPRETTDGQIAVQGVPSTKLATFYLTREEPDESGFRNYSFSRMEMFIKPEKSVKVTLPSTSHLILNGKEVPADYVTGEADHAFNAFLPAGVTGIKLQTYEVGGLYAEPAISVTDANGQEEALSQDEETGEYTAALNYREDLKAAYSERILAGMKAYATHMQNDGPFGAVTPYFDTASEFYRSIAYNLSQFVWDHNGYEFRNEKAEDFYAFDDNTFCCHVSFDHVLHLRGREDYVDVIDMIVFARKKGNNFYIYDRIVQ